MLHDLDKEKKQGQSALQNGDIILQVSATRWLWTRDELADWIIKTIKHCMIYQDNRIYHASAGKHQTGVRSHDIHYILKQKHTNFGNYVVLHCSDPKVSEELSKVIKRWDPCFTMSSEEIKQLPKSGKVTVLPTPWILPEFRKRDKGDPVDIARFELYRGFRAFMRNHADPVLPLSKSTPGKSKGVSCDQFIFYSLKCALITNLFPSGIPEVIVEKFKEIEKIKKENHYSKLSQIPMEHFVEFGKIFFEQFKLIETKEVDNKKNRYLDFLLCPVKGYDPAHLCSSVMNAGLYSVDGYMILKTEKTDSIVNRFLKLFSSDPIQINARVLTMDAAKHLGSFLKYNDHSVLFGENELQKATLAIEDKSNKTGLS